MKIKVKTNCKKQEVKKQGEIYLVSLKSRPENNKANIELLKLLKRKFKKDVKIIKGLKSKEKIVENANKN